MGVLDRTLELIKSRRENILSGKVNCIPSPFNRFGDIPGIERGRYILISAATKGGKTQLMSYFCLFNSVIYAYEHPDQVHIKIFYYNLEETEETITMRFMSHLLYKYIGERISPTKLQSTVEALDEHILEALKDPNIANILKFYEEHVIFSPKSNPTGINIELDEYAKAHGTKHFKELRYKDKDNNEVVRKKFDYYEPDDPLEYVMAIVDHVSLISTERGMDVRESIVALSKNMVALRNMYKIIPIIVQQQSTETTSLDAFKSNKIRPSVAGLADGKYTSRDCNIMLGLTNPFAFEKTEYLGYDITKLNKYCRFLEVVINRDGEANGIAPLFFDGAVCEFKELPKSKDEASLKKVYTYINKLLNESVKPQASSTLFVMLNKVLNKVFHN